MIVKPESTVDFMLNLYPYKLSHYTLLSRDILYLNSISIGFVNIVSVVSIRRERSEKRHKSPFFYFLDPLSDGFLRTYSLFNEDFTQKAESKATFGVLTIPLKKQVFYFLYEPDVVVKPTLPILPCPTFGGGIPCRAN